MKKLFLGLVFAGGIFGLWYFSRNKPAVLLRRQIAEKVESEGKRLGRAVDRQHVMLALERFDKDQLELFDRYLDKWISRDWPGLQQLVPEWQQKMLPVIQNSPEWLRYEGIIFGT